jgi:hypothetical protein
MMGNRFATVRRAVLALLLAAPTAATATGISVDAGLTPPEGRWILRAQYRTMTRDLPDAGATASMSRQVIPLVAVYGLRPELTLGLRQTYEFRSRTMMGSATDVSGFGDLHVFAKYKVLRINTRSHVVGVSPTLAIEPPTGADGISSDAWNLAAGVYLSGRSGSLGVDLDVGYGWNGFAGVAADAAEPGDRFAVDAAVAYQIPLGGSARAALAPVLEISWYDQFADSRDGADLPATGERVFSLAPGLKYTLDDLILEGLARFPVAQEQEGMQMEAGVMVLLGVRRMF